MWPAAEARLHPLERDGVIERLVDEREQRAPIRALVVTVRGLGYRLDTR